jgi:hypothetical protein
MSRRALIVAAAALVAIAIGIVAVARVLPAIVTSADLAVTELYTELATRGRLLVGPDSRFAWNHPGPVYFYTLAPFYALSGHRAAALFASAVAINLAAILGLVWVVSRHERGRLLVLMSSACLLFAWRMPRLLASPWTAHVPVFASLAFVAACGAVIGGRYRLLPWVVFLGSFITQTHLAYVPMVGTLSLISAATVLIEHRRRAGTVLAASAGLLVVLWLPSIVEAVRHDGGNVAALWRFFVADAGPGHSITESIPVWSYALGGIFRPELSLPWGGHLVMEPAWWTGPLAVVQVCGLAASSLWHFRSRRRFEGGVALSALLGSLVELWAVTRIHGQIVDHELIGIVAIGAFNLAVLAAAALRLVSMRSWRWHEHTAMAMSGTALVGCAVIAVDHFREFTSFEVRRSDTVRIPATYDVLRGFFEQRGIERPLFHLDGDATSDAVGVLLRVMNAGWPVAVEEVGTTVFPSGFAKTGQEDALVNFTAREGLHLELAKRPGNAVLRDRHPLFVDVVSLR